MAAGLASLLDRDESRVMPTRRSGSRLSMPAIAYNGIHCGAMALQIEESIAAKTFQQCPDQGCISCGTCSYPELTEDHVLTSAYVKFFRIVTRNAVNKSF